MKETNIINFDEQLKEMQEYSKITVSGKDFNIYKFPIASTILYNDFVALSQKAFDNYENGVQLIVDIGNEKNKARKSRLEKKLQKIKDKPVTSKSIEKKLYDCLKFFIEANGYKFNLKWWQKAYTRTELTQFIHIVSNKDNIDNISKKKVLAPKTKAG